ncbi:MAG: WS/DGAT domain-containing protein, partial [Gemmatimonadales bacterium]
NKCTSVVTNVMGPQVPLALGGRRLRSLVFWVPQRADIGVGISVMTFAGNAQVGVIADTRVLADPGLLVRAIEAEFDALSTLG